MRKFLKAFLKDKFRIPERTLTLLLVCLSAVLLMVFACLLPRRHALATLEKECFSLTEQLEEQKALAPVYGNLKDRSADRKTSLLPYPQRSGLSRDRVALLPVLLGEVAGAAGMQMVRMTPELNKAGQSADVLFVDLVLRGEFGSFHRCLTGLGNLPFLVRFDEIEIKQAGDGLEFGVRLKLAVG